VHDDDDDDDDDDDVSIAIDYAMRAFASPADNRRE